MISKKAMDYIKSYKDEHYDTVVINMKKGTKERIKIRCEQLGMSMGEYARYCIEKEIEKDSTN